MSLTVSKGLDQKAKMPGNRADFTIQVMDDKIITLGGWTDGSTLSTLLRFMIL